VVRRPQLCEPAVNDLRRLGVLDDVGEEVDDVVVAPEVGEVFKGQVDSAGHRAGAAQVTELAELSLTAAHAVTMSRHADSTLVRG